MPLDGWTTTVGYTANNYPAGDGVTAPRHDERDRR
jgi:hypothetical protein